MEYKKIISITAMSGLYELLSSKTDGAIVRSLDDDTTKFIASRVHNFSHLESIEVYTVKENINLIEIFKMMEQSKEPLPDGKNNVTIEKYFKNVYPDLDFERVYASDMKKMIKWFEILQNKVQFKLSDESQDEPVVEELKTEEVVIEKPEEAITDTPVKKSAKRKAK